MISPVTATPSVNPRPRAIMYGVPYLALQWLLMVGVGINSLEDPLATLTPILIWTVIWYTALYRSWRGGPLALKVTAYLTRILSAVMLLGSLAMWWMMRSALSDLPSMPFLPIDEATGLSAMFIVSLASWAGALAVGIGLHGSAVRTWVLTQNPPTSRAGGATARVPSVPATGASDVSRDVSMDKDDAEPYVLEMGQQMRGHIRARIGCFGVLLVLFPGIPLIYYGVTRAGSDDTIPVLAAFAGALVVALVVSVIRFRREHHEDERLTIDDRGLRWTGGGERAEFPWSALAGVGLSYHMAHTRRGQRMHMPQVDIFEREPSPAGTWKTLESRRRREDPPVPAMPAERVRLPVPSIDENHRAIEAAVRTHHESAWIGWFERPRSDTPLILR